MKRLLILASIFLTAGIHECLAQTSESFTLKSAKAGWTVTFNERGSITSLIMQFKNQSIRIPWRTDSLGGPAWKGVTLKKVAGNKLLFEGKENNQVYSLEYKDVQGNLLWLLV